MCIRDREGGRPEFESYRYELWKILLDNNKEFDYIGSMCDEVSYPEHSGESFDGNHEGRGGYTSGQILSGINDWLEESSTPDIVLLSSPGGNDALQGLSYNQAVDNINAIIDILQTANPEVTIIIEQLVPAISSEMTADLTTFFNQMQADVVTIATEQTTGTSQVLTVDMATGFNDSFFADEVHYNEAGAIFVAERYYAVLENVMQE